ncbi:ParB/RepB/Spo0J family partition protein [Streptomyces bohaiensis]|uniref:ParB/RepB/Spo0J family partition protein n=1 Tax=Streptomyces bohaiensis TaxID=1431344 RepID=UPI003B7D4EBE
MSRKPGLGGKSLAEKRKERREATDRLIPAASSSRVPIGQLMPSPTNGRVELLKIDELAESLRTEGMGTAITVLTPDVYVRAYPEHKAAVDEAVAGGVRYVVHHGHRRLAAATVAGLTEVPVLIRSEEIPSLRIAAIAENLARMSLNPIEEAVEFEEALREVGADGKTLSQREFARRVGCSQTHVSHRLALLRLVPELRQAVVNRWRQDEGLASDSGDLLLTTREAAGVFARLRLDIQQAFVDGQIDAVAAAAISKLPQDQQTTTPPAAPAAPASSAPTADSEHESTTTSTREAPASEPTTRVAPSAEAAGSVVSTSSLDVPTQRETPISSPAAADAAPEPAGEPAGGADGDRSGTDGADRLIRLTCEGTVVDIAQAITDLCTAEETEQIGVLLRMNVAAARGRS